MVKSAEGDFTCIRNTRAMAERDIWAVLGIAPTTDERAIRIAYSRRLKAIDVETDAGGFITLRSAYEAARANARGEQRAASWLDAAPEGPARDRAEASAAFEPAEAGADPSEALPSEVHELHMLFERVAGEERRWLSADEKLTLRRCWAAIAAYADGNITRYDMAERATRWLILSWGSLSVGLVPFAVDYFHWDAQEGGIAEDGTIAEIVWRYRAIQYLQRVRRPGHSHHAAWVELKSQYFPGSGRGRVDPLLVHELQAVVRHVWPEVETEFDPGRVALWESNTADPAHPENPETRPESRFLRIVGWIVVGLFLFRIGGFLLAALLAALGFMLS